MTVRWCMTVRWWLWTVGLAAVALMELKLLGAEVHPGHVGAVALVLLAVGLRARAPWVAACAALAAGVVGYVPLDKELLVPCLAGLVGVAMLVRLRLSPAVLIAVLGAVVATIPVKYVESLGDARWLGDFVLAGALIATVAAVSATRLARRAAAVAEARARAAEIAGERHDAVLAERARIARELHDLVAHSVSVIAALAESAPYTVPELPGPVRDRFGEIAGSARGALGDLRDLLAVLRRSPAL